MTNLEAALAYAAKGWHVLPCHTILSDGTCSCGKTTCESIGKHPKTNHGSKDATTSEIQITRWWERWPDANVAVKTGPESGLLVLDFDAKNGGLETMHRLYKGNLPDTILAATGGGGFHAFYQWPEDPAIPGTKGFLPGMDIQSKGNYVIVTPSFHKSGMPYRWAPGHGPQEMGTAPIPKDLLELLRKGKQTQASSRNSRRIPNGERDTRLFKIASALRGKGWTQQQIEAELQTINLNRCDPPMDESIVRQKAASAAKYEPGSSNPQEPPSQEAPRSAYGYHDSGNAERFANDHSHQARYCENIGWFIWNGKSWALDRKGIRVMALTKETIRRMALEADVLSASTPEKGLKDILEGNLREDPASKLYKHMAASCAVSRRKAMVELARSEPGMVVSQKDMDCEPDLIALDNGVLNLRTGELLKHDSKRFITRCSPIAYDPTAVCPAWERFLLTVTGGEPEVVAFLQRAIGYTLTGYSDERALFIIQGPGGNGKSVFIDVLTELLGDYAANLKAETLLAQKFESIPQDIAKLPGVRFAHVAETDEGRRLAEAKIKELTGGDEVTARFLFENEFTFRPVAKWWLGTNHRPEIRGTDNAIWERIKLIPFTHVFPKPGEVGHIPKHDVMSELKAELPGILRWAVVGAQAWYADRGLIVPETVNQAVQQYRQDQDLVGRFLAECCETGPGFTISCGALYTSFIQWIAATGEEPLKKRSMEGRLKVHGLKTAPGTGNVYYWQGVRLGVNELTRVSKKSVTSPGAKSHVAHTAKSLTFVNSLTLKDEEEPSLGEMAAASDIEEGEEL